MLRWWKLIIRYYLLFMQYELLGSQLHGFSVIRIVLVWVVESFERFVIDKLLFDHILVNIIITIYILILNLIKYFSIFQSKISHGMGRFIKKKKTTLSVMSSHSTIICHYSIENFSKSFFQIAPPQSIFLIWLCPDP